jgi:lipopolysaccharide transport system permease protein
MKIVAARTQWSWPDFREVWQFRELLWVLILRDIKVRYKQTVIGLAWVAIQPVMTMIVFTLIFGRLGGLPSDGLPYPLFVFAALLPWQLFARALTQGSASLVSLGGVLGKVYFPRLIAPLAAVLSGLVDFLVAFSILLMLMAWYGMRPPWQIVYLPAFIVAALAAALAVSLWLSALNTEFRDVNHAMPFISQMWFFLTPVIYPTAIIPEQWRWLFALNPMVSIVEGFRWTLVGGREVSVEHLGISAGVIMVLMVGGLTFFSRFERNFVDRL